LLEGGVLVLLFFVLIPAGLNLWKKLAGGASGSWGRLARIAVVAIIAAAAVFASTYKLVNARSYQVFGTLVDRVETNEPLVALTFDDGPNPSYTPSLLGVLRQRGAKATFFVIGAQVEEHPDLASQIVTEGHELGNHSFSHERMVLKSYSFIKSEVDRTDALIRQAGYVGPINFRSPYSKKFILLPFYLSRLGKRNIFWDMEPDSFPEVAKTADNIVSYVLERARPGSIILLHAENPSRHQSLEAVGGILDGLKAKGFTFVTVSSLIAADTRSEQ
jgi:peptidoglycan/xylan/chitin deacetylase (PgdA/CDA1 family)